MNNKEFIPIANPNIDTKEAQAVYEVIKSGWISMGKKVQELEKKIYKIKKNAIFLGIAYAFQKCAKVPVDKNDFKLDYIFTERGIINSNQ